MKTLFLVFIFRYFLSLGLYSEQFLNLYFCQWGGAWRPRHARKSHWSQHGTPKRTTTSNHEVVLQKTTVEHGGPTGAREATPRCLQVQSRKRLTKTSEHPKKMGLSNVRAEAAPWSEDGLPDAVAGVATRRIFGSSSDQTQGARHLRVGVSASSVTTRTAGGCTWEG